MEFIDVEPLLQVALCIGRRAGSPDDMHHLVDIVAGDDESFEDMGSLLGLAQVEFRAADGHVVTVLDEIAHTLLQREQTRTAFDQSDAVDRERTLQGGHLEELVEDDIRIGLFFHIDHDAHTLPSRLVVDVGNALDLTFFHQVGDVLDQLGFVDTIGDFGDHDLVMGIGALDFSLGAHDDASATGLVGISHTLYAIDVGSSREVRGLDIFHQPIGVDVRVINISTATVNHLAQVVGGDIGGHTDSDAIAAVDQQIGHFGRHDRGLCERVVKIVDHIDGILLQVIHDMLSHLGETALCVSHGSRGVTIHTAEVSLSVDQRVTHVPILCHAHECTIYRTVAMGVVLTEHLTHDAGTFLVRFVAGIADAHHAEEYSPVYGLEAIAHIWQGPGHDDRHRVVDVGLLHLFFNVDLDDSVLVKSLILVHYFVSILKRVFGGKSP